MRAWLLDRTLAEPKPQLREAAAPIGVPPGSVTVEISSATICGSDLHLLDGGLEAPERVVLGHEGVGTVVGIGDGVLSVRPGNRVFFAMIPRCGRCTACGRSESSLCERAAAIRARPTVRFPDGDAHRFLGLGTFSDRATVPVESVVRAPEGIDNDVLSVLSCSGLTGVGATLMVAKPSPGEHLGVIGCGAVGLAAIAAAAAVGVTSITALDTSADRLAAASGLGARDVYMVDQVDDALAGVFDATIDAVGTPASLKSAWSATRRGGRVVALGGLDRDLWSLPMRDVFFSGKQLTGSVYGSVDLARDLPGIFSLMLDGSLSLSSLVTHRHPLADLPTAIEQMRRGIGVRHVLEMT